MEIILRSKVFRLPIIEYHESGYLVKKWVKGLPYEAKERLFALRPSRRFKQFAMGVPFADIATDFLIVIFELPIEYDVAELIRAQSNCGPDDFGFYTFNEEALNNFRDGLSAAPTINVWSFRKASTAFRVLKQLNIRIVRPQDMNPLHCYLVFARLSADRMRPPQDFKYSEIEGETYLYRTHVRSLPR